MTISYRSFSEENDGAGTSVTIIKPAGVVEGDMLVLMGGSNGAGYTFTLPGFTKAEEDTVGLISTVLFYKIAGASEPADYTITRTGGGVGTSYQMIAYSTDGTFDTPVSSVNTTPGATSLATTSVTAAAGDAVALSWIADIAGGVTTPPSGPTSLGQIGWSSFSTHSYYETGLSSGSYSKTGGYGASIEIVAYALLLTEASASGLPGSLVGRKSLLRGLT